MTCRVARYVVSPTSTPPGGAAACSRAPMFITSPAAMPSPERASASRATSASPVAMPTRTWSSSPGRSSFSSAIASCADGALGVVLVHHGGAEERYDGVADELLHRAAVPLELGAEALVVRREHGADVLRVDTVGPRGRADDVGVEDGQDLSLLATRGS